MGGSYLNREYASHPRLRQTSSRQINCPYRLYGSICHKQNPPKWYLEVRNCMHNHPPSMHASAHPAHRKVPDQIKHLVTAMISAGVPARNILTSLNQEDPSNLVRNQDLYNLKKKLKREQLGGKSVLEYVLGSMANSTEDWLHKTMTGANGNLEGLFFAHPSSIKLARRFNTVCQLDCTYKTNCYRYPLLHIVGMASTGQNFTIGFAMISHETQEYYNWALSNLRQIWNDEDMPRVFITDREMALVNAIEEGFTKDSQELSVDSEWVKMINTGLMQNYHQSVHLLCTWHINKNIVARCKKMFRFGDNWEGFFSAWNSWMGSRSVEEYEKHWDHLETHYLDKNLDLSQYIRKVWLKHEKKFVALWTSNYSHFGNTTTSRVEGAHSSIKSYLLNSTGDLFTLHGSISRAMVNQTNEIQTKIASQAVRTLTHFPGLFQNVHRKISHYALMLCKSKFDDMSEASTRTCTHQYFRTMGIPCSHMLKDIVTSYSSLQPSHFHTQWHLSCPDASAADISKNLTLMETSKDMVEGFIDRLKAFSPEKQIRLVKDFEAILSGKFTYTLKPILDPEPLQQTRGRPPMTSTSNVKIDTSTKRDPSLFEIAEKQYDYRMKLEAQELEERRLEEEEERRQKNIREGLAKEAQELEERRLEEEEESRKELQKRIIKELANRMLKEEQRLRVLKDSILKKREAQVQQEIQNVEDSLYALDSVRQFSSEKDSTKINQRSEAFVEVGKLISNSKEALDRINKSEDPVHVKIQKIKELHISKASDSLYEKFLEEKYPNPSASISNSELVKKSKPKEEKLTGTANLQTFFDKCAPKDNSSSSKSTSVAARPHLRPVRRCIPYTEDFPSGLSIFIQTVYDPPRDGDCGYNCIGSAFNLQPAEVRLKCHKELQRLDSWYKNLWKNMETSYEEIFNTILVLDNHVSYQNWMRMPQMGHVLSNVFEVPIVWISKSQSVTFFPFSIQPPSTPPTPIYLAFVQGNHWVRLNMSKGTGMWKDPPLPPIDRSWCEARHTRSAINWEHLYQSNFVTWSDLFPKSSSGPIDLD